MRAGRRTTQEQMQMVNECRASGLTIADWCRREGIRPDTYHTWVSRLSEKGLLEKPVVIPQPIIREPFAPDIVKVEITSPPSCAPEQNSFSKALPRAKDDSAESMMPSQMDSVMEIFFGAIRIKVTNQVSPQLLADTIRLLGGEIAC